MTELPPLHRRIREHVLHAIRAGDIKPGDKVPSENALGAQFGVSRVTVQRALRELVAQGLLRRVQGSGTFVASPSPSFSLIEVRDLVDEVRARGGEPRSEVLIQRRVAADEDLAELFDIPTGTELFHASILQMMDCAPVALEERFAVCDVYPDFLEQNFEQISVFRYFASRSALGDIENVVHAMHPTRRSAQLLEIATDDPCLFVQRRNWWQGRTVTLTRITYAGARQALASRYKPFSS